jgi:hypothetical protein
LVSHIVASAASCSSLNVVEWYCDSKQQRHLAYKPVMIY